MTGRRNRVPASSGKNATRPALAGKRPLAAGMLSGISPHQQSISDSSQLKNNVEVRLQAAKDYVDHEHASVVKQIEAQSSKLNRRWKQETQNLTKIAEAADADWRNFLADHEEDTMENQKSVKVLFSKLDASATHFTKTCIPELLKSMEVSIDAMKNRYARATKSVRRLSAREKLNAKFIEV